MKTELRVIELSDIADDVCEYAVQYRNDQGPWITVPVKRVFSQAEYDRMKEGEE